MSIPNIVKIDEVAWEPHPRFAALQVKVLESKATHAYASVMLVRVDVGGVIPEHSHSVEIETAHVLSGEAVLTVEGQDYPFSAGINASIPIGAKHSVRNTGDVPLMIYAVHTPPVR
jgi:quercetin dioxygenase-like cupin family protein